PTQLYSLSLHDALPIWIAVLIRVRPVRRRHCSAAPDMLLRMRGGVGSPERASVGRLVGVKHFLAQGREWRNIVAKAAVPAVRTRDRKSTRLNSSHLGIS